MSVGRWILETSSDLAQPPMSFSEISRMLELAEAYKEGKVASRDLIHTAVMLNHGIERILSTDRHFDLIHEVKRLDPKKIKI